MDLASKLCSFALTQAVSLVEHALDLTVEAVGEKNKTAGVKQPLLIDSKQKVIVKHANGGSTLPQRRRRRAVRLEIKTGGSDMKWSVKCLQTTNVKAGSTSPPCSAANVARRNRRLVRSGSRPQRPVIKLPTIQEEELELTAQESFIYKDTASSDSLLPPCSSSCSLENKDVILDGCDERLSSVNLFWENRLRSRDCLPRCTSRAWTLNPMDRYPNHSEVSPLLLLFRCMINGKVYNNPFSQVTMKILQWTYPSLTQQHPMLKCLNKYI